MASAVAGASLLSATTAHANAPREFWFGQLGLALGINDATEADKGGSNDAATVFFIQPEASGGYRTGDWMFALQGNYRYDDFGSSDNTDGLSDDEDPEKQWTFTAHVLHDLDSKTRVGGFFQYGDTLPQDGDGDDAYDLYLIGAQAQTFLADNVVVFGQVALGDKNRDGGEATEGFNGGYVMRAGLGHFLSERTTLVFDTEFAGSRNYIDSNDPGRFFGVALSGETLYSDEAPLYVTYGVHYTHISSTDEGDNMDEIAASIGVAYRFGDSTTGRAQFTDGIGIGAPRLPTRASAFTEWVD